MRPSLLMAEFVRDVRHVEPPVATVTGFCIDWSLPGAGRFVVLEFDRRLLVSAGCYQVDRRGLSVADPEMVFYLDEQAQWLPIELTRVGGEKMVVGTVAAGCVALRDPAGQAALAAYADRWARQLRAQFQVAHSPEDERQQQPAWATLMDWLGADGGCEATDGCWVEERDGVCEHGQPSWLVALGLL
jgi:hypothetical protein